MSDTSATFSGRTLNRLRLVVSVSNGGTSSTANWALYLDGPGTSSGSFTNSATGSVSVNIGGNVVMNQAFPAYNTQTSSHILLGNGAVGVPNGTTLGSAASASGVNLLGSASLSAGDATAPGTPGAPSLSSTNPTILSAAWTGAGDGGSGITNYRVYYGTDSGLSGAAFVDSGTGSPAYTITGLTPGRTYYVATYAQNALGFGGRSGIAGLRVGIGGRIWDGTAERPLVTAKVWNGTAEVDIAVANLWGGSSELGAV